MGLFFLSVQGVRSDLPASQGHPKEFTEIWLQCSLPLSVVLAEKDMEKSKTFISLRAS